MKSLRLALRQPTSLYKGGRIPPACLAATHLPLQGRQNPSGLPYGNPAPFTKEADSLRLPLPQPTSLYLGIRIPPACLTAPHLPFQRRQNPSGLPYGNPPPFTREAESLRLALRQPTSLYKGGRIPPACLAATHLPLQGRQNPSGLP